MEARTAMARGILAAMMLGWLWGCATSQGRLPRAPTDENLTHDGTAASRERKAAAFSVESGGEV